MFYIFYFLKNYKNYIKKIFLGIILSIINNLMNLFLSITSGYLLTHTFLVGIKNNKIYYNYIIPSTIIRLISVIKIITKYFEKIIQHNNTLYFLKNLRILVLKKIFPLYPSNLILINNIEILNILIADIEILDFLYLRIITPFLIISIITLLILLYLSIFNIFFFMILFINIIILTIFYLFYFYKKGKIIGKKNINTKKKYYYVINNFLSHYNDYQIFEGIKYISSKITILEKKLKKIQLIKNNFNIYSELLINIITDINILLLLIYNHIYFDNIKLQYKIILFILFLITFSQILFPLNNIFQNIYEILFSAKKIFNILEIKKSINFINQKKNNKNYYLELNIKNLYFYYKKNYPYILKNLSLYIKKKQKIAITGYNGCGKSTLFMLLTRAWDPIKGKIYLNKYNLNKWDLLSLRKNISVLPQKIYLFSDTLKNNILLNNQNNLNISDKYLIKVLKLVGLKNLLDKKNNLNIWMGEGGRILSGGELKKLGIARIILHNGNLILLDELTEGLDIISSTKIINLILSIFQKKIIIFITHNINIMKKMDCIYFMDDGFFVEKGNYKSLVNKKGYYWNYIKNNIKS
ncbi:ATP-binding cassette domain-containing protein [Enterobacteriaceae endosymbiont of Donacia bicoloricornis]|uniref:ATP-binding cassette domain-containing protein n=1 Tax=Enterobacteriaceae endosymbiont of Donacia bicoloricornis TaxID=2675772 RepID=UPI0014496D25|nr:ATP-binding cassette domain-containing protein [Enterobacteriaceae endosymbiont of Donacia bicoloricornis]QJC37930.1 ATP-binding cassette domain-containing protein [Enterobacteriaceae endosymbiont of Donacia bicoloricornis]